MFFCNMCFTSLAGIVDVIASWAFEGALPLFPIARVWGLLKVTGDHCAFMHYSFVPFPIQFNTRY